MERYAWSGRVKQGQMDEYIRRHDALWHEMKDVLREAGIVNYTVFADGLRLFGYYECAHGAAFAAKVQGESPVVARWNAYMQDILELEQDPQTGAQDRLAEVFRFES